MRGRVKWFNDKKGFGFIDGDDKGSYFVHYSQVQGGGYRTLLEQQVVEFDVEDHPKGKRAVRVVTV